MRIQLFFVGLGIFIVFLGCVSNLNQPPLPETTEGEIETPTENTLQPMVEENNPIEIEPTIETQPESISPPDPMPTLDPNATPVLFNLGVNFGSWNKQTNKAGDFLFKKGLSQDKIFMETGTYVVGSDGPKLLPEITFQVPEGTEIFSPVSGNVETIKEMYSGDYFITIRTHPQSNWMVTFEHLVNLKVKEGDVVEVGTIVGEPSLFWEVDGIGFYELVVWKGGPTEMEIYKLCPLPLLDESVQGDIEENITQLANDWETYMGKDIYDQEEWESPGCLRNQLTEYEAANPGE